MPHPSPRAAAYGLAFLVAVVIAWDLLWMPVQLADSIGEILDAQRSPSAWASFAGSFGTEAYLRPLRIAQIKALFDAAHGSHYWLVYRGFHAVLLVVAVLLFVRALRVTTSVDFAAAAFALVVLTGLQTFRGTIQEAFPINHFLEILVFCLMALNLAQSRGGIWIDAAAALIFVIAVLTLESGLLVWVVAAAAWAAGWRGISARGLAVMTVCLLGYLYVRFVYLSSGVPALAERSSGYLVSILDPPELQRRFGGQPLVFYGYNVAASAMSVLFSEPQSGVFVTARAWLDDRVMPRVVLPVAASLVTTALIARAVIRRAARRHPFDDTARFILVFAAVLAANAVLSFAYTKDDIMSTAGAFYALAAFAVMRDALLVVGGGRPHDRGRLTALSRPVIGGLTPFALLLVLLAIGWSVRSAGVHYVLRSQAIKHQVDWVEMPGRWRRSGQWPSDPARERLILLLRDEGRASCAAEYPRGSSRMARAPVDGVMTRNPMITLVSLPPVLAFAGWLIVLAIAAVTGRHPIWSVEPGNLPEAVAFRDAGGAVRRIERGEDPNRAAVVRGGVVLDETASLTPIEAAAATRQGEMVQLLLDLGASPDATVWQRAWCISDAAAVREVLEAYRPPGATEACAVQ